MKLLPQPLRRAVASLAAGLCLLSPAAAEVRYTLVNLDLGNGGYATAMNSLGQVTGVMRTGSGANDDHVFLYSNGTLQNLGKLGANAVPQGLNDRGEIVGIYDNTDFGRPSAFIYSGGAMRDVLGRPDMISSRAWGINDAGQILMSSASGSTASFDTYILHNGQKTPLIKVTPRDINDAGGVTGSRAATQPEIYLRDNTGWERGVLPLGQGLAINDAGHIVGEFRGRAFFYDGGDTFDVIAPADARGIARDLNNHDHIVGRMGLAGDFGYQGFIYTDGRQQALTSLIDPTLGLTIVDALAINDAGDILAQACTGAVNGSLTGCRSVILDSLTSPVPEPQSLAMMGLGLGLLALRRRRAQRGDKA